MEKTVQRVSVLINNFNHARFLEQCIHSVLEQTRRVDEVIVFDDGSTDDSLAVLARYGDRINVIAGTHGTGDPMHNQHRGIATAFAASTGDLVFLLDGDDAFAPGKVEAYRAAFEENANAVLVQSPLWKIDDDGKSLGMEFDPHRHQRNARSYIYRRNELNVYYPTSAQAYRRSYLEQLLPLDHDDGHQVWSDARLALIAPFYGEVVTLLEPYTFWRRHRRSHTVARPVHLYALLKQHENFFNDFCARTKRPLIHPWRNWTHWKRAIRYYFIPDFVEEWFRKLRWLTLSKEHRQAMLVDPGDAERKWRRAWKRELSRRLRCAARNAANKGGNVRRHRRSSDRAS